MPTRVSNKKNTKRRRTSSRNDDDGILTLCTLPGDHLTKVSSYLAPTSKLLLACAFSAPSTSFGKGHESLTNESLAILSSMGSTIEVLDFGDVGDLVRKLSDDDIGAVLVCIDAKSKLKQLILSGCNRLVGHGLESLRESTVLKHISLHLPLESLSASVITPIFDSIVDSDGNSLREIKVTNIKHAKSESIGPLLKKFNKLMTNGDKCDTCVWRRENGHIEDHQVNATSRTCFECFRCYCEDCNDYTEEEIRSCNHCGLSLCREHGNRCDTCFRIHCSTCTEIDTENAAKWCETCKYSSCFDCVDGCKGCLGLHFSTFAARNSKREEELNGEIAQLRSNNVDLTEENEELRREIAELQERMSSGLGILS